MVKQFSAFEYEHIISLCDFYLMDIRSVVLHLCYIAPILYNIQIEREREESHILLTTPLMFATD